MRNIVGEVSNVSFTCKSQEKKAVTGIRYDICLDKSKYHFYARIHFVMIPDVSFPVAQA